MRHSPAFFLATFILGTFFAAGQGPAQVATAASAAKETVKFDGNTLVLAPMKGGYGTAGESLKEFLPEGENFDAWTKMAAIHVFPKLNDPLTAAADLKEALEKQYPGSPSSVIKNSETGDAIIDFIILSPDSKFAEWNVMKYAKNPGGGLTMCQYALRAYGDEMKPFLLGLKTERKRLVAAMAKDGLTTGK